MIGRQTVKAGRSRMARTQSTGRAVRTFSVPPERVVTPRGVNYWQAPNAVVRAGVCKPRR